MTTQLHLAAQYLAAAGINFIEKKEDDSHTNLGFSIENSSLYSRKLGNKNIKLNLNYKLFVLEWEDQNIITSFPLHGKSHLEILEWLRQMANQSGLGIYSYNLHYDLPYQIKNDFVFELKDDLKIEKLIDHRVLANTVIQSFLDENNLTSEIRIWPHHFDTGAFTPLKNESDISIGLGMAIPDTMIDDYYFYISAYRGHDSVDTTNFNTLSSGQWKNEGFKGAVLPLNGIDSNTGVRFFNEAFQSYKK
ncbi:hypothetical protein M0D21_07655 [Aquimarina sp. D1M17]|uniref:hypothetical protein n=1 Tax=Aquimarina acroporae TaxID=2937283 RepID=UPI0020C0F289|nr:hypothetical protein [Aquimarina acroporae]MCK8521437.1 hypothetical protein [Aquimarina acroporae]